MTAASTDLLADLERIVGPLPPAPHRVLSAAEQAAEDYWAGVGEAQKDQARMGDLDDRWMQDRVDNWTEREAS